MCAVWELPKEGFFSVSLHVPQCTNPSYNLQFQLANSLTTPNSQATLNFVPRDWIGKLENCVKFTIWQKWQNSWLVVSNYSISKGRSNSIPWHISVWGLSSVQVCNIFLEMRVRPILTVHDAAILILVEKSCAGFSSFLSGNIMSRSLTRLNYYL